MSEETRDIDLVLITGAGASTKFGNPNADGHASATLPLMEDWSDSLIKKLGGSLSQGPELVGLSRGLEGPEFERRLGRFLSLSQMFPDLKPILEPSVRSSNNPILESKLPDWHMRTQSRLLQCVQLIHESLYENFAWERTLPSAARAAYGRLFQALGVSPPQRLVYATTNYDSLGESAVDSLGWRVDVGERTDYHGPGVSGEIRVDPEGLLDGMPRYAPVFHLHGALGWYRRPADQVPIVGNAKTFDKDMGVPLIMLPDPNKNYTVEPVIESLWGQFRKALGFAKRVFVLGHSLNDMALVEALQERVEPLSRIGVGLLADDNGGFDPSAGPLLEKVREVLPQAGIIPVRFEEAPVIGEQLSQWLERQ